MTPLNGGGELLSSTINAAMRTGLAAERIRSRPYRIISLVFAAALAISLVLLAVNADSSAHSVASLTKIDQRAQRAASALRSTVIGQQRTIATLSAQVAGDNRFADLFRQLIVAAGAHDQARVKLIEHKFAHERFTAPAPP